MKTITGTYKCGHGWTTTLARGGTKHEINCIHNNYARQVCPKCAEAENSVDLVAMAESILFAGMNRR